MAKLLRHGFIATSFDKQSLELAQYLANFLDYFGVHCEFGKDFGGESISLGIRSKITTAFIVIALLTRKKQTIDGSWEPSQCVVQELTIGNSTSKPCIVLLEDGVSFSNGLTGDVEYIPFNTDCFSEVLPEVLRQVMVILKRYGLTIGVKEFDPIEVYVPKSRGNGNGGDARTLHETVLTHIESKEYDEGLKLAKKLTTRYPNFWRGWISLAALYVKSLNLPEAKAALDKMLECFLGENEALAAVYHNQGWILEIKAGPNPSRKSLNEQERLYRKALGLDSSRVYTRAALICTYALLNQSDKMNALIDESGIYGEEFLAALRHELKSRGTLRVKILSRLPTLLQNMLYPVNQSQRKQERRRMTDVFC